MKSIQFYRAAWQHGGSHKILKVKVTPRYSKSYNSNYRKTRTVFLVHLVEIYTWFTSYNSNFLVAPLGSSYVEFTVQSFRCWSNKVIYTNFLPTFIQNATNRETFNLLRISSCHVRANKAGPWQYLDIYSNLNSRYGWQHIVNWQGLIGVLVLDWQRHVRYKTPTW